MTRVTIPDSVTTIGKAAFASCSGLNCVTLPASVTTIGQEAFSSCSSLISVAIPASITTIGGLAFFKCSNLQHVYFSGKPPPSIGAEVFDRTSATLYYLPTFAEFWPSTLADRPTQLWDPAITNTNLHSE